MKIVINGFLGQMGQRILSCSKDVKGIEVVGGVDISAAESEHEGIKLCRELKDYSGPCDVLINFSAPAALPGVLDFVRREKCALVEGTTGFSDEDKSALKKTAEEVPIIFSPNMSLGVNFLFYILPTFVKALNDWDIELLELHHKKKKDAPSGTAERLLEIIQEHAPDKNDLVWGRQGQVGKRKSNELGCFAIRGGDVVGEHTVYFLNEGERIELTHKAQTRDTFARGAVQAAVYIHGKSPGLYSTFDMIKERI